MCKRLGCDVSDTTDSPTGALTVTKSGRPDRFYAFAAAFGALWGTMEITLGAFLHTLRVPLAGILLSAVAAMILVGERQLLPRRGLALATGIVAAICKTISPGGIIITPMIAIVMESVLVEAVLLIAPRAMITAGLAGAMCTIWSAFQGLITQYIFYGKGVLDLYMVLLKKSGKWLGLSSAVSWWVLAALIGVIAATGALGGVMGLRIGRESRERMLKNNGACP